MAKRQQEIATSTAQAAVLATEAPLLLALVTCPALLIPYGQNPFEPHKAAFLWMATAAACGAIVGSPATARRLVSALSGWRVAMIVVSGLAIVSMLVSTMLSEAPALAWWGSALRAHGTLTEVSILLTVVVILLVATGRFAERLQVAAIVASIGPTVYALCQALGVDPLTWDVGVLSRASSTFGNPLFFGGYLITVWPLTLGRALVESRNPAPGAPRARAIGLWILVILQSVALVVARARGPALALLVALVIGSTLAAAAYRRRLLARTLACVTLAATAAFIVVAPARMGAIGARDQVTTAGVATAGTVTVRLILWDAVARGIEARAHRMVVGLGPEAITGLVTAYARSELQNFEGPNTAPDRAHNVTLERLVSFGAVGLALQLTMAAIVLAAALSGLGLLGRTRRPSFFVTVAIGFIGAGAVAVISGGGFWALAVAAPAAAVMVVSGWIAWRPGGDEPDGTSPRWEAAVPIVAATVVALAYLIDVSLSIETVASSLNAAAAAAIIVVFSARSRDKETATAGAQDSTDSAGRNAMALAAGWSVAVLTLGLSGAVREAGAVVWTIALLSWILGIVIAGVGRRGMAWSLAAWLTVVFICLTWRDSSGATSTGGLAIAVVDRLPLFYVLAGVCIAAAATTRRYRWSSAIAAAAIAGAIVGGYSVRVTSADVLMQSAARLQASDAASAIALSRLAGERNPSNAGAFTLLADTLIARADGTAERTTQHVMFSDANDALGRARIADPFDYHHARNLAALHRRWARVSDPEERRTHQGEADQDYRAATGLAPNNGRLWTEWANLDAERGNVTDALAKLDRSASLGVTVDVVLIGDAIMRAQHKDTSNSGMLRQISLDLKDRGYTSLARLYAQRAAPPQDSTGRSAK